MFKVFQVHHPLLFKRMKRERDSQGDSRQQIESIFNDINALSVEEKRALFKKMKLSDQICNLCKGPTRIDKSRKFSRSLPFSLCPGCNSDTNFVMCSSCLGKQKELGKQNPCYGRNCCKSYCQKHTKMLLSKCENPCCGNKLCNRECGTIVIDSKERESSYCGECYDGRYESD
jgi:hypothetical protein